MTAPTINGTRYPQPVEALLPAARKLVDELGEVPSRNRLMREFRIGAPKAEELRDRLARDLVATPEQALREVVSRALQGGPIPTGEQIATQYRLDPSLAELVSSLAAVGVERRANGLPTDLDDDWTPPYGHPDDERENAPDEPATDPWLYAEPIGPDPVPAPVVPESAPPLASIPAPPVEITPPERDAEVSDIGHPGTPTPSKPAAPSRPAVAWPVVLLALPAFVAIWSGWVGLGGLTGFGIVHPLPGIADGFSLNTAITLPIGVETYGAYALYVWLSGRVPERARRFAKWSALGSLTVGALGQVAYHLLVAAGIASAPWWITTAVACLPVAVLGMGAALAHLVRTHD